MIVFIEHFLNEEGRSFFPTWISKARTVMANVEGFESIVQLSSVNQEERTVLMMQFTNLDNLKSWAASEAHAQLLELLKPFMLKKQQTQLFEINQ